MSRSIGRFIVELLSANGIDTVFGIPGVHNLELYRGLAASRLRHVLVRHEQGAGFAADGYARSSGRPAAAFTISGPGVSNILTAAAQAHSDSVPLLVIASTPKRDTLGKRWGVLHELRDQAALAAGIFGVARTALTAEDVCDHLRVCFAELHAARPRPAYLEIPLDVLAQCTSLPVPRFATAPPPVAPHAGIVAAAGLLNGAARRVVIAGGGARRAARELERVIDALACPLVTTVAGKGLLPEDHDANLGASLPYGPTQDLLADAEVVLAVGTELAETDVYTAPRLTLAGRLIRIDVDPAKLCDHYGADLAICGDAGPALEALHALLDARPRPTVGVPAAPHRARIEHGFGAQARSQLSFLRALRRALPGDGAVFSDMTQIAYLGNYAFGVAVPGCWFHPSGYGTLGYALPAALGAKIACPDRAVIALAGDFGVQFTGQELMTAVEAGLPLPIVVWNNGALGQIRDDMQAAGIPLTGVIGRNPDFVAWGLACGAAALRVKNPEALEAELRDALGRAGPTLIEVVPADP